VRNITRIKLLVFSVYRYIPLVVGISFGIFYSAVIKGGGFYWLYFTLVGGAVTLGVILTSRAPQKEKDRGRRICLLLVGVIVLFCMSLYEKANFHPEEIVFSLDYLFSRGVITETLIFFFFMRIVLSFIVGRSCCGWGCRTAALFEWLPIKKNNPVPKKYTNIRYIVLFLSLILPFFLIVLNLESGEEHYTTRYDDNSILWWVIISNALYYIAGTILAFRFQKQRAFCKILCPEGLIMSFPARLAGLKKGPAGPECIECGRCNQVCPMDVNPMTYISRKQKIASAECIHCLKCVEVCPVGAIK
jgi:ferredoxin-type protein NapH